MRDDNDPGTLDLITGGLILGYARVSTDDQDLTLQRDHLRAACHFQKTIAPIDWV